MLKGEEKISITFRSRNEIQTGCQSMVYYLKGCSDDFKIFILVCLSCQPGHFLLLILVTYSPITIFHSINRCNMSACSVLKEAEDIKGWQEYTEELYKKDLHDPDNHHGVITLLEPDILECEVKWALGSITTNKASGSDGIPVELFQILKDDAVKVLHSICQQIWKIKQWPQDWKRSLFIPIPKKGNAKECSNYHTVALISYSSKIILKILQAKLQQYMNCEIPDVQAGFRKGRGTRDQIANIHWIIEKAREFQKNIYLLYWLCRSLWLCGSQETVENSERDGNTRPPDLPIEKPVCRSGSNS